MLHPPAGSGFLFMEIDITKVPFTSISRENWEMLMALDKDTLYSVIQTVGSYVLTGEKCECDNTLSRVVCGQLISVIDRKAEKSRNSANNINKRWEKQTAIKEPTVTVQVDETQTPAKPQTQKPQRVFGTQGEAIDYLVEYSKTHSKYDTEYERNKICREYGFNYKSMIDEYMERKART